MYWPSSETFVCCQRSECKYWILGPNSLLPIPFPALWTLSSMNQWVERPVVSVILLTFNLFLFNADQLAAWNIIVTCHIMSHVYVGLVGVAPLAPMFFPGSQYSNFTFNIFIALLFFWAREWVQIKIVVVVVNYIKKLCLYIAGYCPQQDKMICEAELICHF